MHAHTVCTRPFFFLLVFSLHGGKKEGLGVGYKNKGGVNLYNNVLERLMASHLFN